MSVWRDSVQGNLLEFIAKGSTAIVNSAWKKGAPELRKEYQEAVLANMKFSIRKQVSI